MLSLVEQDGGCTDEAAQILQLNPATVRIMAKAGKLPSMLIGNRWRFRASSLDAWIQKRLESNTKPRA